MRIRTKRFGRYLQRWWDRQLGGATCPGLWQRDRDASAIASEFRRDAQFAFSQAAFLLQKPDFDTAGQLVAGLVPAPTEADTDLIVEAIVRAGATAQKVRVSTVAGALVTVAALVLRNILRGR